MVEPLAERIKVSVRFLSDTPAGAETRLVEFTCRHRALVTRPFYDDWLGTKAPCEVCGQRRTIVWTDDE